MKSFKFLLLALAISVTGLASAQGKITVSISNLKSNSGVTRVCLFNNSASFNGEGKPLQCVATTVKNRTAVAVFENIPAGTYAISAFHDVNNNNKLDVNFLGIPKEGYGASQNKLPFASAPSFKENQFVVQAGNTLHIPLKLRHL